jgi:hypothetical protein
MDWILNLLTTLRTTNNYSATANLHTLQITTVPAKPFPPCCLLTNHSLATASNSGDSSASCVQVLLSQLPVQNFSQFSQLPTELQRHLFLASLVELNYRLPTLNSLSIMLSSESQSYFTTGGLQPISLTWRQVP